MTPNIISALVAIAIIAVIIIGYRSKRWHSRTVAMLLWWLFPFTFYWYTEKERIIKHWWIRLPLWLFAPLFCCVYLWILLWICVIMAMGENTNYVPDSTNYHTAYDLEKVTGVAFPEVIPVDSFCHDDWGNNYTRVKFVPKKPLGKKFFKRLDKACREDTLCWAKGKDGYYYHICPTSANLDRTKKGEVPYRLVEEGSSGNRKKRMDWDGTYIDVTIPLKGDTITIEDGWIR